MIKDIKNLVEIRNELKRKKPVFVRQDANKKKRLGLKWRRPKGMHSKLRRMLRGHPGRVEPGWGSPKRVKGLSKEGLKKINVRTIGELSGMNPKTDGAVIASDVGMKRRIELLKKSKELGIRLLNINIDSFMAKYEEEQKARQEKKTKTAREKEEKKKELEKKAAEREKESKKEEKTELDKETKTEQKEEMKEQQKKELDKTLTKKDSA